MNGKKLRIAISGKARVGKNSVAELIVKHSGIDTKFCKIVALADPMKNIAKTIFPEANDECLFGRSELRSEIISEKYKDKDGNALTYRQFLLDLGAFGRKYNDNIWLNILVQNAKKDDNQIYIVADCRFYNEFEYLKKSGFYMIRVKRPVYTKINDISEIQQDSILDKDFNIVIDNNGTLKDLDNMIADIVAKL